MSSHRHGHVLHMPSTRNFQALHNSYLNSEDGKAQCIPHSQIQRSKSHNYSNLLRSKMNVPHIQYSDYLLNQYIHYIEDHIHLYTPGSMTHPSCLYTRRRRMHFDRNCFDILCSWTLLDPSIPIVGHIECRTHPNIPHSSLQTIQDCTYIILNYFWLRCPRI